MNILKEFFQLLHDNQIMRRYIVMNSFDGALSVFGILLAFWMAGVRDANLVLVSAIGVTFATGISGVWGGYLAEKAERKHELSELKRLNPDENIEKRRIEFKRIAILMGLSNGLSSTIVGLLIMSPFFLVSIEIYSITAAFLTAFILLALVLVFIGVFTAHIAKENPAKHALLVFLAASMVGIIIYLFERLRMG